MAAFVVGMWGTDYQWSCQSNLRQHPPERRTWAIDRHDNDQWDWRTGDWFNAYWNPGIFAGRFDADDFQLLCWSINLLPDRRRTGHDCIAKILRADHGNERRSCDSYLRDRRSL